jgi:hypothetical protein
VSARRGRRCFDAVKDVVRWGTAGGPGILGLGRHRHAVSEAADFAVFGLDREPRYFGLDDPPLAGGKRQKRRPPLPICGRQGSWCAMAVFRNLA